VGLRTFVLIGAVNLALVAVPVAGQRPAPRLAGFGLAAFSPDGKLLLTTHSVTGDGPLPRQRLYLQLWDVPSGKRLKSFAGFQQGINYLAFWPDGKRAIAGNSWGGVGTSRYQVLDLDRKECVRVLEGKPDWGHTLVLSADGQFLLTWQGKRGEQSTYQLWDATAWKVLRTWVVPEEIMCTPLALAPGGQRAVVWCSLAKGSELRIINTQRIEVLKSFELHHCEWWTHAVLSPDGKWLLLEKLERAKDEPKRFGHLVLWDVAHNREHQRFECREDTPSGGHGRMCCATFTPGGKHAITGDTDGYLRRWDLASGKLVEARQASPYLQALSPDGTLAAVADAQNRRHNTDRIAMQVWDVAQGRLLKALVLHLDRDDVPVPETKEESSG
jgi:WD40 repeat protein